MLAHFIFTGVRLVSLCFIFYRMAHSSAKSKKGGIAIGRTFHTVKYQMKKKIKEDVGHHFPVYIEVSGACLRRTVHTHISDKWHW